ncbi:hypothetical protein CIL05_02215 [Virgibacillus profundi]|uniref:DUF2812 domain-containing protein n=1 Tax=Virgibacillus profundi TaxID=2024555 RepID=A0A2A2IHM1_9BACI|nr:DUF2812 domain-containing protein [Virgibacillus profundi]PAV31491.1 hypothetical protein CIL05_02215 [Virgibacillus profundi]PXY55677.1 DUF2812 domain-containing protein [Virgibacillus profundi]
MRQTKYITSGGLAFSEKKDMEKLRSYSFKGWHVSKFTFMGYTLEKGVSSDYIYSLDYRWLNDDDEEEYFEFFSSAGWSHVTSEGNIHLFRAHPGTKPIYTDRETTVEKYENSTVGMLKFAIPLVLITALVWVVAMIVSGTLKSILLVAAVILSAIVVPTVWTVITAYSNKWKVEGRRGLGNLGKTIPFLFLLIAVIILLFGVGTGATVDILTSMMIGGIALPTAIWLIMSLYHKIGGKRG